MTLKRCLVSKVKSSRQELPKSKIWTKTKIGEQKEKPDPDLGANSSHSFSEPGRVVSPALAQIRCLDPPFSLASAGNRKLGVLAGANVSAVGE